jgi:hypothetical protein
LIRSPGLHVFHIEHCWVFTAVVKRPIEQFVQIRFATVLPFVLNRSPSTQVVHAVQF